MSEHQADPKRGWRDSKPPDWYAKLPTWLQVILSLALLVGLCGLCSYGASVAGMLDPAPTPTATPLPAPTSTPTDTATVPPTEPPTTTPPPSPTPNVQAAFDALKAWAEAFNADADQRFFQRAEIEPSVRRCRFTVSDIWYTLPDYTKERLLNQAAEQCNAAAVIHLDMTDMTTSLYSISGTEVAFASPLRSKINE